MKPIAILTSTFILVLLLNTSVTAQPRRPVKIHPVGTLNFTTITNGKFSFDGDTIAMMTPYHQVIITGINPGSHTWSFRTDAGMKEGKIMVAEKQTCHYILLKDSLALDSCHRAKIMSGTSQKVQTFYIPRKNGAYGILKMGLAISHNASITGQFIAGYQITPVFSVGGGIGYFENFATFNKSATIIIAGAKIRTEDFPVSYFPVFADIRLYMKKKVAMGLSIDLGCSFPLRQQFGGRYTYSTYFFGYTEDSTGVYQVNKVNPGLYIALNPGLKWYTTNKLYFDFSIGLDLCINKFEGDLMGSASITKTTSNFHICVGFGF